jgi:hypothetical protein
MFRSLGGIPATVILQVSLFYSHVMMMQLNGLLLTSVGDMLN